MSLEEKLGARRATAMERFSIAQLAIMRRATEDLRASGIAERALKAGDHAPEWQLPDGQGNVVRARDLLKNGPLVLTFFRGIW
ncbi:MAG TPA: hypothetical protein VN745_00250 [Verrucomicrobiae bacterium]|nr:hypothetical protein [Verrucomicrobiae bacterium]